MCNVFVNISIGNLLLTRFQYSVMKPPTVPKKEDCCNSGCTPCIFDVYEEQLKLYESFLKSGTTSTLVKENAISQLEYTEFHLIKCVESCKEHKLLMFKKCSSKSDEKVFWSPGQHFLVKCEFKEHSCTRAYTPINIETSDHDFAIIVKRYNDGLVSNYLYNLNVGENTLWRGPYGDYKIDSKFARIIMIAQGTGVAPFYSIIKHILDDEDNMTTLVLLYCCRCIKTIMLRDDLYSLKSYWNFKYSIHLGETSDKTSHKYQEPIVNERLSSMNILNLKPFTDKDQFLLCGSDEFMKYYEKWFQQENVHNIFLF